MAGDSKKILLVDDDTVFVESLKSMLEAKGFTVGTAYDGKEGLKRVSEFQPDLIILDVMMPVMNGSQACKELKADPATQTIPVILLTAIGDNITTTTYTPRDVLESNSDDYLAKPVPLEALLESIQRLL